MLVKEINFFVKFHTVSQQLNLKKIISNILHYLCQYFRNLGTAVFKKQVAVKSWIHCYFCSCISSIIKFIDVGIFFAHLTDKVILSLFFAIFSGHFEESTPFPTDITVFMVIAQPAVCRLEKILFRFSCDSLLARLNSPQKARSYKKQKYKRIKVYRKSAQKEPTDERCLLILHLNPLQDYKSSHKWQSQPMSKNKTTSKVSLKLNSRIKLEWQGAPARRASDFGHSPQAPPQPGKGHSHSHNYYNMQSQLTSTAYKF